MDEENKFSNEGMSEKQINAGREGHEKQENGEGYQPGYRTDRRAPRPRIQGQRPYQEGNPYRRYNNEDAEGEDGFRTNYDGYNRQGAGYGYGNRQGGGYGNRQGAGYGNRQGGGYGYGNRQGAGYSNRQGAGYGNRQGGGYGNRQGGGYGNRQGTGYGYGNRQGTGYGNRHGGGYDPNAKYSLKKRIEYKEENYDPNEPIRLNKFLANAGVCSRREADEFIQAGVISVNGEVVTELGSKVLRTDEVKFHDQPVSLEKKVYILLNKPKDYVTTTDDPQQRKTVMELVKNACKERIYPVGRLDRNTTGVLLLTNDGEMASRLTHPKFIKKKIYHVFLDRKVTEHDMQQIREGITLEDGEIKVDAVEYADPQDKKQVGVEIHSGKNRIVRRIFESLGYRVTKLDRVQFVGLTKKNLRRGDWRYLTEEEVERLRMGAYE